MAKGTCADPTCSSPVYCRALCIKHYSRWYKTGESAYVAESMHPRKPRGVSAEDWFWQGFSRAESGCLEWQRYIRGDGYGYCSRDVGDGSRFAHRVAWILTNGVIPDGIDVLHKCDNPPCGDPDHLFLGTHADNMADMAKKGRSTRGRPGPNAKLAGPQVLGVLLRLEGGESNTTIGRRYGVTRQAIAAIRHGKTWKHYSL